MQWVDQQPGGQAESLFRESGEANLPRQSVVEVSKLSTVDKAQLGEYIGSLARLRIDQILGGIQFFQRLMGSGEMGRGR